MTQDISRARLAKAVAATALLVISVPAIGALSELGAGECSPDAYGATGAEEASLAQAGIDARTLIGRGDALGFLSRLEEASTIEEAAVPEAFEEEVGLPVKYRDLRVSESGTVIGFVVDASAEAAASDVRSRMAKGGWSEVPLGSIEGATFVKAGGKCSWTLVTCTQAGPATNVVYRCVFR